MKTIGIVGYRIGEAFGVANTYLEFAQRFGKPRILMPQDGIEDIDALLLPGGQDVNPLSYREPPAFATSSTDVFKQYFFDEKLPAYVGKIPIFGICLGFQQLNVHFGGKLCQHLKWHENNPARWTGAHDVNFTKDVYNVLKQDFGKKHQVNSHHHQAVLESTLSEAFIPLATIVNKDDEYSGDLIVEAFIHSSLPIAGVQWHPEEWYDDFSLTLFDKILNK
jgi:putative glutamine amidotransferase